jgi:predicted acylesterase/phospholipase RssA
MVRRRLRLVGLVIPPLLLVAWLAIAGSYSWLRDAVLIGSITLVLILSLRHRARSREGLFEGSAIVGLLSALTIRAAFVWGLTCWIAASMADVVFRPPAQPLRGAVVAPPALRQSAASLRIGLAMSGGGYRAALVHAGVLQELAARGIPVTNIASVSGGSIIGAFVAHGGDPADFVDAVKHGRFRFKRELLSAFALPRWIFPFGHYSRRDVQAGLVRRVLLASQPGTAPRPALMLATTDLRHGLSVGVTGEGLMMAGPTTDRFFRFGDAVEIDGLGDVADIVAVSGAFPGAFPAMHTAARLTVVPEPLANSPDTRTMPLALVDGGVRDNLGVRLLQGIDQEVRGNGRTSLSWRGFKPSQDWALDLIIVSDGGQSFEVAERRLGLLAQVSRAIDLSGLETGILRPVMQSADLPVVSLSIAAEIGLAADATIVQSATRPRTTVRRDYFRPRLPDDPALAGMVELVPNREAARQALANYARTRGATPMNVGDLEKRCQDPASRDAPECHWRTLADLILDDIDHVAAVFRRSATLEDQYSAADVDALTRLGRYFVLLKLAEIEEKLADREGHIVHR